MLSFGTKIDILVKMQDLCVFLLHKWEKGKKKKKQERKQYNFYKEMRKYNVLRKNGKSPGESGIQIEAIKYGGVGLKSGIYNLIALVWEQEKTPKDWKKLIIVHIHKKGDNMEFAVNYRGIALLNTGNKLLSHCIKNKLQPLTEEVKKQ